MAESNLTIGSYLDDENKLDEVWCKMASGTVGNRLRTEPKTLKVTIDITGDLAMCAMVLGKEGMSPHCCHLCQATKEELQRSNLGGKNDWVVHSDHALCCPLSSHCFDAIPRQR
mmetsp:Transcript_24639/g.55200  ORF Transcript_24639/g.55200 Transcript_24639/m.55200 type:complete len:114 (+) Transcript_24639:841-1182(+)